MSSAFSMAFGRKEYPYNNPNNFVNFDPEEMLRIVNPSDINPDILSTGQGRLGKYQYEALKGLIELKESKKKYKKDSAEQKQFESNFRQSKIDEMRRKPDYATEERSRKILQQMANKESAVPTSRTKEYDTEMQIKNLQERVKALGGKRKRKHITKKRRKEKTSRKYKKTYRKK